MGAQVAVACHPTLPPPMRGPLGVPAEACPLDPEPPTWYHGISTGLMTWERHCHRTQSREKWKHLIPLGKQLN